MKQQPLIAADHQSFQTKRLKKYNDVNPERIYAAHWKRKNRREAGVNGGAALIEWILCPSEQQYPSPVSRRDAAVAASVIQWLGTNCGLGFIWEVERKIDKARRTEAEKRERPSLFAVRRDAEKAPPFEPIRAIAVRGKIR